MDSFLDDPPGDVFSDGEAVEGLCLWVLTKNPLRTLQLVYCWWLEQVQCNRGGWYPIFSLLGYVDVVQPPRKFDGGGTAFVFAFRVCVCGSFRSCPLASMGPSLLPPSGQLASFLPLCCALDFCVSCVDGYYPSSSLGVGRTMSCVRSYDCPCLAFRSGEASCCGRDPGMIVGML
jgi:hypothetical protein